MSPHDPREIRDDLLRRIRALGPVFRGSVAEVSLTCGKENCRCRQGRRHHAVYASYRMGGKTRVVHIPDEKVAEARFQHENWLQLKALLEQLADVQASLWKEVSRDRTRAKGSGRKRRGR